MNLDNLIVTFLFLNRLLNDQPNPNNGLSSEEIEQLVLVDSQTLQVGVIKNRTFVPFVSNNINRNNRRTHFRTAFTIFIRNAFWNGSKLASCVRFVNKMLSNDIIYFRINIKIIFFLQQWKPSSEKLYRSSSTYFCQIRWNYIFQVVPNNILFQPSIKKMNSM